MPCAPAATSTSGCTAFGPPRDEAGSTGFPDPPELAGANAALMTMGVDLALANATAGADLVHSHTWYANFAGHVASLLNGVPHVVSAHSLEPMRPWKAEQLGGGYRLSSWIERTAYESAAAVIAVSAGMREDVLRSYPDIDPGQGRRRPQRHRLRSCGSPPTTRTYAARAAWTPTGPR